MRSRFFSLFDYFIFFAVLALLVIGVLFIYSSAIDANGELPSVSWYKQEYIKQIIYAITGLFLIFGFALFDYRKTKKFSFWFYIAIIIILIITRLFGTEANNAKSWINFGLFMIQPAEFCKILYIFFLAWFLEKSDKMNELKRFIIGLASLILPVGLILLQPDMGTASVFIPIFLVMCFFAGVPLRYIMLCLCTGMLTIFISVIPVWESMILQKDIKILNILTDLKLRLILISSFGFITILSLVGYLLFKKKYYYWIAYVGGILSVSLAASILFGKFLKDYQIMRLIIFINPDVDPLKSGWNIIQAKIAIGSGNFFGRGFLQGSQSHLDYLPEQSTDFIFCILAEEWGFLGGLFVFICYFIIFWRAFVCIRRTKDIFGSYIACGITSMFAYHFFINVGMVMGIMPITGIPLLFLSYGGSSLWMSMMAIGILQSINLRRLEIH
ncbi:MAG: rod shape-determining protein RodA [Treponemataceae bacterium]|nr:rod shape-determining protein RodA [Treponemataceae bacterium]